MNANYSTRGVREEEFPIKTPQDLLIYNILLRRSTAIYHLGKVSKDLFNNTVPHDGDLRAAMLEYLMDLSSLIVAKENARVRKKEKATKSLVVGQRPKAGKELFDKYMDVIQQGRVEDIKELLFIIDAMLREMGLLKIDNRRMIAPDSSGNLSLEAYNAARDLG